MNSVLYNVMINEQGPFSIECTGNSYSFTERLNSTYDYGYLDAITKEQEVEMLSIGNYIQVESQ